MDFEPPAHWETLRAGVRALCARYGDGYWRRLDAERAYPEEFIRELSREGWLSTMIPEEFGGGGMGLAEAGVVLEEVNRSGANANAAHAQVYMLGVLLRHGSAALKGAYLPRIAAGELRLQAFAITEPDAGSDTTRIATTAERRGDTYVINGEKVFISRVLQSDLMLVLARTTPLEEVEDRTRGLSLFLVDLREAGGAVEARPLRVMMNNHTNAVTFRGLEVPAGRMVGGEGDGFRCVIDSWNAERILIAAECIGDGRWFIERASARATERVVFGRPIGANQGVQLPIAQAYAHVEAADLVRHKAAARFDAGLPCGPEANMAKLLASQASWEAANVCLDAHGGYGFLADYDVERKFRETRLYTVAPINNTLVLAYLGQRVLGMPRSY